MKTPLNKDYLADVNGRARKKASLDANTYKSSSSAAERIRKIVGTSRGCSIPKAEAEKIWDELLKDAMDLLMADVWKSREVDGVGDITNNQSTYKRIYDTKPVDLEKKIITGGSARSANILINFDHWMLMLIIAVAHRLKNTIPKSKGALGIAQKVVNLMIKDHWALGMVNKRLHDVLHIPVDRRSLSHISKKQLSASDWEAWTLVCLSLKNCMKYLRIQFDFRDFYQQSTPFSCTMELDQVWWKTINV